MVDLEGLPNVNTVRKYDMMAHYQYHLNSYVKGQYLELDDQNQWVDRKR